MYGTVPNSCSVEHGYRDTLFNCSQVCLVWLCPGVSEMWSHLQVNIRCLIPYLPRKCVGIGFANSQEINSRNLNFLTPKDYILLYKNKSYVSTIFLKKFNITNKVASCLMEENNSFEISWCFTFKVTAAVVWERWPRVPGCGAHLHSACLARGKTVATYLPSYQYLPYELSRHTEEFNLNPTFCKVRIRPIIVTKYL